MKRIAIAMLAVGLLLCACGKKEEDTVPSSSAVTTEATTVPPTTTTVVETTEPTAEYRHPLTGAALDAPFAQRPMAVAVNNIKACLPQYGIGNADWLYEVETEGGITRCLAVFTDVSNTGSVGPVRSTRSYFNNLAMGLDAPLIHCGGSQAGLAGWYGDDGSQKISNWEHVDGRIAGNYFFRDKDRYNNQGYAWEHTLFTTGENLTKLMADKGFDQEKPKDSYGLQFAQDVKLGGTAAKSVTVNFDGGKTTTMTYQEDTGTYRASQYGSDWMDAGTGKPLEFRNLLVIYTSHWFKNDGTYNRSYYDLVGSGDGQLAVNGEMVPIKWHRENPRDSMTFTLKDGKPITLNEGRTYCAVTTEKSPVKAQ